MNVDEIQGVVFVLIDHDGRVLMERDPKKAARHGGEWFIPGGRIEPRDSGTVGAMYREMDEELGCEPRDYRKLPVVDSGVPGAPFLMQPFLVWAWAGTVPEASLDRGVPLRWMAQEEVLRSPVNAIQQMMADAAHALAALEVLHAR